jgi:hypothetical protein
MFLTVMKKMIQKKMISAEAAICKKPLASQG